jgi:hypothetical protein
VTTYEYQFHVNQGWAEGAGEWVSGDIWFAGIAKPRSTWVDDVGVYRPSTRRWYYDFDHNGNTDDGEKIWGWYGALPVAGDFNRDRVLGDVALYEQSNGRWSFDYKHDRTLDEQFTISWADRTGCRWLWTMIGMAL